MARRKCATACNIVEFNTECLWGLDVSFYFNQVSSLQKWVLLPSGSKWHNNIEIFSLFAELPPISNRWQRRQQQPMRPTDVLKTLLCACGDIIKTAWCWRLQCPGTSMHTKASKSCLRVKTVNLYLFAFIAYSFTKRENICHLLSFSSTAPSLPFSLPVCVGHTRYLLHPLNSQGLWNAHALYIH